MVKHGFGKLFFGLLVLVLGAGAFAHELGWLGFELPWVALALMALGLTVLADWFAGCSR